MATPTEIQEMLDSPALAPPPGVRPNFVNPENLRIVSIAILALCVSISTLVFCIRMYTKLFIFRKTGWEDYTSLIAWLMYMGYFVLSILVIPTMGGVHQWNVRVRDMITILYYYNIAAIIYGIVIAAVKLSLLLQYLEIFMPIRNYDLMVVVTYIIIGSNLIFYLACTFFEIFACTPREMFWNRLVTNGHCFNMDAINISSATINCISDFVILLLPQGVIWRLQITFRRKLGISAMFLTGLLACITSIIRIYYAVRTSQTGDISYNFLVLGLWSHAEMTFGIICGCLPVLPKFFSTMRPKISMLFKSCVQIQTIPQLLRLGRFPGKRGDADSSGCTDDRPYELQRESHSGEVYGLDLTVKRDSTVTSSAAGTRVQSIAATEGDPTTGLDSV